MDERLARAYGFTPRQSDKMLWVDVARFYQAALAREEQRQREKVYENMMLVQIVHASKPADLLKRLMETLDAHAQDYSEVGERDKLRRLKMERKSRRRVVGGRRT